MQVKCREVEFAKVPKTIYTGPREAAAATPCTGYSTAETGLKVGGRCAKIPINAYSLQPQATVLKTLRKIGINVVRMSQRKVRSAIIAAEQRYGVARVAVGGVTRHFYSGLIGSQSTE